MDMSFSTQALAAEWCRKLAGKLEIAVHNVPQEIEEVVALLKLQSMNTKIDRLTPEQTEYLASSGEGT
jgi:adenosylhomocysteinase